MVGYLAPDTTEIIPLAFRAGGDIRRFTLPTMMTVTGPETNVAAACLGIGLIQVPRYRVSTFRQPNCLFICSTRIRASCRRGCGCSSSGQRSNSAPGPVPIDGSLSLARAHAQSTYPPSIVRLAPVMYADSSLAR
jgi:hypothetical protein